MNLPENIMRGAYPIRKQFAEFLSVMVPRYVDLATNEWSDIPEVGLQAPVRYDAEDPYEVGTDEYPTIGLIPIRSTGYRRIDFDESGGIEYQSTWTCQLFIATQTRVAMDQDDEGFTKYEEQPRSSVIGGRDDLTGIVMNVLLAYPDLALDNDESTITVDETSLTVDYVQPLKTPNLDVWVAVTQIGLSLKMREIAWTPPLSVVHEGIVQVDRLGN